MSCGYRCSLCKDMIKLGHQRTYGAHTYCPTCYGYATEIVQRDRDYQEAVRKETQRRKEKEAVDAALQYAAMMQNHCGCGASSRASAYDGNADMRQATTRALADSIAITDLRIEIGRLKDIIKKLTAV